MKPSRTGGRDERRRGRPSAKLGRAAGEVAERLLCASTLAEASAVVLDAAMALTSSDRGVAGRLDTQTGEVAVSVWRPDDGPPMPSLCAEPWSKKPELRRGAETGAEGEGWTLTVPALAGDVVVGRLGLARGLAKYRPRDVEGAVRLAALYAQVIGRLSFQERLAASTGADDSLFDSHPDGVAIISDGRFVRVSPAFADLLGRPADEILGRVPTEFVVAAEHDVVQTRLATAQGGTRERPSEYRIVRPDGATVSAEAVTRVIVWEGRPAFLIVFRDVSRRKAAEEGLLRRERVLQGLAEFDAAVAHLGTQKVLRSALQLLREQMGADRLNVVTVEPGGRWGTVTATEGDAELGPKTGARISLPGTLTGAVVSSCKPLYAPDYTAAWGRSTLGQGMAAAGVRSGFVLPLLAGGTVVGTLNAGSRVLDGITEEAREVLTLVAPRLASALENARLFEEKERGETRFRTIYDTLPVSIWEEDFSALSADLAGLRDGGVTDIRAYLREHPEYLRRAVGLIRVEDVNDYTLQLYGAKDRAELLGSLHRVFTAESYSVFADLVAALHEGAPYFECEGVNRTLAGEPLSVMVRAQLLQSGGRVIVSVTDITGRKRAEERFHRRMQAEKLVANISSTFIDLGPGQVEMGIRQALQSVGEFLGADRCYALIFSEDGSRIASSLDWAAWTTEPTLADRVGALLDTVPWFAEKALAGEGICIARLSELPPEAVVERAIAEAMGVKSTALAPIRARGETVGVLGLDAVRQERRWADETLALLRAVGEIFFSTLERERAELALRQARDELERRVAARTAELEQAKRELEDDIAARERAEAEKDRLEGELRQSRVLEAVGHLAGGVAHDFNNILGSVIGCLYAAKLRGAGDQALVDELDRAQALCKRGGELTRQLLTVARRRPGRAERLDVGSLLNELGPLLERALPKDISLRVRAPDPPLAVEADRAGLTVALLNLGLNARDAMPKGGELRIGASRVEADGRGWVSIEVSDSGSGIPEELRERIFDPFFTTKPPGEGSGLGLSTVAATAREFGGRIALTSSEGEGSVFTLLLPLSGGVSADESPRPAGQVHPLTRGLVLVVEDEEEMSQLVAMVLKGQGYTTLVASTGLRALEIVQERRSELGLVALDLVLPGLGGAEVYRLLRGLAPEIPVLVITGREDLARALGHDVIVLPKPFMPEELLAALEKVVGARV